MGLSDPKLKIWETGLICENCRRKAVALTLIKSGDAINKREFTNKLVDKKICYTCIARYFSLNYFEQPPSKWSGRSLYLALVFFTAGWLLLIMQIQLVLSATLFILFITSIAVRKALEPKKHRVPIGSRGPNGPLINTADFFETSTVQSKALEQIETHSLNGPTE